MSVLVLVPEVIVTKYGGKSVRGGEPFCDPFRTSVPNRVVVCLFRSSYGGFKGNFHDDTRSVPRFV